MTAAARIEGREFIGAEARPPARRGFPASRASGRDREWPWRPPSPRRHCWSANSVRSAEISKVFAAPRCTPPMPPVAKTCDARHGGNAHGGGDRRGAIELSRNDIGQIAGRDLADCGAFARRDIRARQPVKSHSRAAAEYGDGGGNGAVLADDVLDLARRLDILRIGHAMGDDGRFKRHDGPPGFQRGGNFIATGDARRASTAPLWNSGEGKDANTVQARRNRRGRRDLIAAAAWPSLRRPDEVISFQQSADEARHRRVARTGDIGNGSDGLRRDDSGPCHAIGQPLLRRHRDERRYSHSPWHAAPRRRRDHQCVPPVRAAN